MLKQKIKTLRQILWKSLKTNKKKLLKWIIIVLVLVFLITLAVYAVVRYQDINGPRPESGTTIGNMTNGDKFAYSDGYYYVTLSDPSRLCRIKEGESEPKVIYEGYVQNLNVIDGWIYGVTLIYEEDEQMYKLIKVKDDGSETKILCDIKIYEPVYGSLVVVEDKIYYGDDIRPGLVHKRNLDGSGYECEFIEEKYGGYEMYLQSVMEGKKYYRYMDWMSGIQFHDMDAYYMAEIDEEERKPTYLIWYDILEKNDQLIAENAIAFNAAEDAIYYMIDDSKRSGVYSIKKRDYKTGKVTLLYETTNTVDQIRVAGNKIEFGEDTKGAVLVDSDGSGNYQILGN